MDPIDQLRSLEQEISLIESITSTLSWDQQCIMPSQGNEHRGKQLAYLSKLQHKKETSEVLGSLVEKLEKNKESLTTLEKRSVELARRNFDLNQKLPAHLVSAIASESSKGHHLWNEAKNKNDDSIFLPQLEKLIKLTKEKAKCLNPDSKNLYNNLLSQYNWGMTCTQLDNIFGELREKIPALVTKITQEKKFRNYMEGMKIKTSDQEKVGYACLNLLGFDPKKCDLHTAPHPFSTTLGPSDHRITTYYDEKNFASSLLSTVHEMGHSLYEQGLPQELYGTSVGKYCSLGIHESQSLFWEKKVGTCKEFLKQLWPVMSKYFSMQEASIDLDKLYYTMNHVKNSLIRVDSDEVTYSLHIVIRYEMEKLIINENLPVEEIKETWNQKYQDYLGITPHDSKTGFLQDVHWACGDFGYFPSYALGHIISSQIEQKLVKDLAPISELIAEERIPDITKWLKENIHQRAFTQDPSDLIKTVTGEELNTAPFLKYLENKFLSKI